MILSFSGDPFLVARAARKTLKEQNFTAEHITELGEGMNTDEVSQLASQSGLFGPVALLLDFDAAFKGQAGVKPRNSLLKALKAVPDNVCIVILDLEASTSRQKTYKKLGKYQHLPTPRFSALTSWVKTELINASINFKSDVPQTLVDLFAEDLPAIAAEIQKLAVLDEVLSGKRVREIVNRLATRDAFDLIEACVSGDVKVALHTSRSLLIQGEAPQRISGALQWQYNLVAKCVAMRESRSKVDAGLVSKTLKIKPFIARKALSLSEKIDEAKLRVLLATLLEADIAMKTGKDAQWALESLAIKLAGFHSS